MYYSPYNIYPRIWFGGEIYTHTRECHINTTHILNVCCEETATAQAAKDVMTECLWIYNEDSPDWPILGGRFTLATEFLDRVLSDSSNNVVYIHCHEGVNRSAAVAVAYRCSKTGESAASVIKEIRDAHPTRPLLTNDGFLSALLDRYK